MNLVVSFGLIVISLAWVALWFAQRRAARMRRLRLAGRTPLNADDFWQQYYKMSEVPLEVVEEVLPVIAEAIEVPAALLRPTDRFVEELAPEKGWEFGDGLADVSWWVQSLAKRSGRQVDLSEVRTVDDLIKLVHGLTAPTTAP